MGFRFLLYQVNDFISPKLEYIPKNNRIGVFWRFFPSNNWHIWHIFWNFLCADRNQGWLAPNRYLLFSLALERNFKNSNCTLPFAPASSVCQSATMFLRKSQQTPRTYPQVPIKIDMSRENESCLQTLALNFPKGQLRKSTLPPIMVQWRKGVSPRRSFPAIFHWTLDYGKKRKTPWHLT